MPAYRSPEEGEIRDEVVAHLREQFPGARIIHEINHCGFGNRIDVLAVTETQIAAVEIKSKKDVLKRLPHQIEAMSQVTQNYYAALHERFMVERHSRLYPPKEARGAIVWAAPKGRRHWPIRYPSQKKFQCLPPGALHMLWSAELKEILKHLCLPYSRTTMPEAVDLIRWNMTGENITREICAALRARDCVEADAPIPLTRDWTKGE